MITSGQADALWEAIDAYVVTRVHVDRGVDVDPSRAYNTLIGIIDGLTVDDHAGVERGSHSG